MSRQPIIKAAVPLGAEKKQKMRSFVNYKLWGTQITQRMLKLEANVWVKGDERKINLPVPA